MRRLDRDRALERVENLSLRALDLPTLWEDVAPILAGSVPHHLSPCWFTLDPASLLVTSHYDHGMIPELAPEWLAHEYYQDDVHQLADAAKWQAGVSTLHQVTDGEPSRSRRWRLFVQPFGGDQELLAALRAGNEVWGVLALYRAPGQSTFDAGEIDFLRQACRLLAQGARRALLFAGAMDPDGPDDPGLLILGDDWRTESMTLSARRWLTELADEAVDNGRLPPAVLAVAGATKRAADGADRAKAVPTSRVLTREGRWVVLHGAEIEIEGNVRTAVIIEAAEPARISTILMSAYGLTQREQDVTRLVLTGTSTREIASSLHVSANTVQQHLKNIFDKTGVRSRRELAGKVFFSHYEPRLRDNEQRALDGQPLRGGPVS